MGGRRIERRSSVVGLEKEDVTGQHFHCWRSRKFLERESSSGHRGTSGYSIDTAGGVGVGVGVGVAGIVVGGIVGGIVVGGTVGDAAAAAGAGTVVAVPALDRQW